MTSVVHGLVKGSVEGVTLCKVAVDDMASGGVDDILRDIRLAMCFVSPGG